MLQDIDINRLAESDLQGLIADGVPEGHQLEYKRELWPETGDGQKEYLNDLAAFANASGGDLVIGMAEKDSVATDLVGLDVVSPQALQTALENRSRNRIEPPVQGIRMRWIVLANGRQALVIRVPSSLSGPHRDRQSGHFFIRGETRKDQMGIHELRDAFFGSEHLTERLRQLHLKAVDIAHRPELPFDISPDPAAIVSVMPLDVLRARRELSLTVNDSVQAYLPVTGGLDWNLILEGVVWNTVPEPVQAFALTHRQGRVDAYWTLPNLLYGPGTVSRPIVSAAHFEDGLKWTIAAAQKKLGGLGVAGPWIVMTSLVGIAGANLPMSPATQEASPPTRRAAAHLPEVFGERVNECLLLPVFDAFWRVFGRERPVS